MDMRQPAGGRQFFQTAFKIHSKTPLPLKYCPHSPLAAFREDDQASGFLPPLPKKRAAPNLYCAKRQNAAKKQAAWRPLPLSGPYRGRRRSAALPTLLAIL
jgi:hypothetical protein